jgi:hypothetical protein
MVIEVKCPKCGNVWKYKGHAVMATCTSCYRKVRVRSLPDPDPAPKAPEGVRKLLAKKPLERDGQTIQGETHEQPTGRKIQVQTITAPASVEEVRHTRTPLTPSELQEGHVCQHCHKPIRSPKMGFWIDGHTNLHAQSLPGGYCHPGGCWRPAEGQPDLGHSPSGPGEESCYPSTERKAEF